MKKIYSNIKFLNFPDQLTALKARQMAPPVHIRIKPTNKCNHHCWYCAYRADDLKLGEDMDESQKIPSDKMFEIVDDIIDMGVKAVTFSGGGEPLLYKDLPAVVTRLAEGGVNVATLTNGANLKGAMADAFAQHGTWVRISVDAWDDASYTKSRGARDGEFTRLLENIANFTKRDSQCVLGISFIISKENSSRIAETCALFKAAGASHVKLSGAVVGNDASQNNTYHGQIRDQVANQITQAKKLDDEGFLILDHYHDLGERFDKEYDFCPFLMYLTVIGADQAVYTCQDKAYTKEGMMGSLSDQSFKDFWFSKDHQEHLYGFSPLENCQHHCVSHAKNLAITEFLSLDADHSVFV